MRPVNLAARPFRNERLPATALTAAFVLLAALTIWHAVVIRDLLPARTSERHQEVAALESEAERLQHEARRLKTDTPPAATLAQWNLVKDLVDRRAFSWTGLFARLEQLMPDGVRLTSVSPAVSRGQVRLDLDADVRSREAGWEFVRVLENGGDFYDVYPRKESGNEFTYVVRYRPQRHSMIGPPEPPPSPARDTSPEAAPSPAVEARR